MIAKKLLLVFATFMLVAACTHTGTSGSLAGEYVLQNLNGVRYESPTPLLLTIQDGRIVGKGPVNNWSAPIQEGNKIGPVISTKMAGSPEQMQTEAQLLKALEGSVISTNNNHLLLKQGGSVVLIATPKKKD